MYKILIIEDKKSEIDSIGFFLGQLKDDFDLYETIDCDSALEYIENNKVDIIFIDVDDNQEKNFEIIKHNSGDAKIIACSTSNEYNCVRRALRLGASDYILKPIDMLDLSETIKWATKDIDEKSATNKLKEKSKEYIMEYILHLAISGSNAKEMEEYIDGGMSLDFLEEFHCLVMLDFNSDFFGLKGVDFKEKIVADSDEYVYLNLNAHQSLFFYKGENVDYIKKAEGLIGKVFLKYGEKCFAAVSTFFEGSKNLPKAMEELDVLIENKFYYKPGEVFYKGMNIEKTEPVVVDDDTIMKQMKQALKMKDANGLRAHFENFCHKYRKKTNFSQVYIKFLFANLLKDFNEVLPDSDEAVLDAEIEALYKAGDFNTVIMIVNKNIDCLEEYFMENPQMMHREVDVVKQYICEHFGEELGIDKLAELVFMAPSYLSSIFKKETGLNLSKFIKAYRMERAKDMLENSMSKIIDISVACGYPNVSYFCSSFREFYGVSPQKYRENGEDANDDL